MKLEYLILIILLIYYYKTSIKDKLSDDKNKKFIKENLKQGSKIITKSGIIAEVIEIDNPYLLVVTGNNMNQSYLKIEVDSVRAIIDMWLGRL